MYYYSVKNHFRIPSRYKICYIVSFYYFKLIHFQRIAFKYKLLYKRQQKSIFTEA